MLLATLPRLFTSRRSLILCRQLWHLIRHSGCGCVSDRTSLIACAQPGLLHVFALCDALSSIVERAPCTVQWRTYTLVNSTANTCGALAVAAASSADWHSETVDRVWLAPDTDISSATDGHYMLMLRSIDSGGDVGATISVDWWIDGSPPPPPSYLMLKPTDTHQIMLVS